MVLSHDNLIQASRAYAELERLNAELEDRVRARTAELEQSTSRLVESEQRRSMAIAAGKMGSWDWDLAAGSLLVTEAGGICGEFNGESSYLNKGDIIAASPKVFGQMITLLSPFA